MFFILSQAIFPIHLSIVKPLSAYLFTTVRYFVCYMLNAIDGLGDRLAAGDEMDVTISDAGTKRNAYNYYNKAAFFDCLELISDKSANPVTLKGFNYYLN